LGGSRRTGIAVLIEVVRRWSPAAARDRTARSSAILHAEVRTGTARRCGLPVTFHGCFETTTAFIGLHVGVSRARA
jgi:hypothetical protein